MLGMEVDFVFQRWLNKSLCKETKLHIQSLSTNGKRKQSDLCSQMLIYYRVIYTENNNREIKLGCYRQGIAKQRWSLAQV